MITVLEYTEGAKNNTLPGVLFLKARQIGIFKGMNSFYC